MVNRLDVHILKYCELTGSPNVIVRYNPVFLGDRWLGISVLLVPPFWFYRCVMSPLTRRQTTPYDEQNPLFWFQHEVKYLSLLHFPDQQPQSDLFADPSLFFFGLFTYLNFIALQIDGWGEAQFKDRDYLFKSQTTNVSLYPHRFAHLRNPWWSATLLTDATHKQVFWKT